MFESALYLSVVSAIIALFYLSKIRSIEDRSHIAIFLFGVVLTGRGIVLYFFFNSEPLSSVLRSIDYFLSAAILPLGLQMIYADLAARTKRRKKIAVFLSYLVASILAIFGIAVLFFDIELVRQIGVIVGLPLTAIVFVSFATILYRNPIAELRPEISKGSRLIFIGFLCLYLGEGVGAGIFREKNLALLIHITGALLVAAGGIVQGNITIGNLYLRLRVGFIQIFDNYQVGLTNLGGRAELGIESGVGVDKAKLVVKALHRFIQHTIKTGEEVVIPYTNISALDQSIARFYRVDILPHQLKHDGSPFSILILINDVTSSLKERETERLTDLLDQIVDERNRAEFYLDLLSHDIANLLQGILLGTELYSFPSFTKTELDEINKQTREQVDRAIELVRDVNLLAEAESSRPRLAPISVIDRLENAFLTVQSTIPEKVINWELHAPSGCPMIAAGPMLEQSFSSVIRHCIRQQENNPASLSVIVTLDKDDDQLVIEISHPGMGVSEELKSIFFEWEMRSKLPTVGVGLPLAKSLAERYQGSLTVRNRVEDDHTKGAVFIYRFSSVMDDPVSESQLEEIDTKKSSQ